jgi:hypothetical protein
MGIVAMRLHMIGSMKSAISPSPMNISQNIFRCMGGFYAFRHNAAGLLLRGAFVLFV